MADVYLRDLKPELREEFLEEIRNNRSDLLKAVESGENDVVVGEYLDTEDYHLA